MKIKDVKNPSIKIILENNKMVYDTMPFLVKRDMLYYLMALTDVGYFSRIDAEDLYSEITGSGEE